MTRLTWWMRIVGGFYLLQFVMMVFVRAPIRAVGPQGALAQAAAGDLTASFLVDTWVTFGLEVGAIGAVLLIASHAPGQAIALVWAVIAIELARGIADDIYMLARGYDVTTYAIWIFLHTAVIVTGLLSLRNARSADRGALHPRRSRRGRVNLRLDLAAAPFQGILIP